MELGLRSPNRTPTSYLDDEESGALGSMFEATSMTPLPETTGLDGGGPTPMTPAREFALPSPAPPAMRRINSLPISRPMMYQNTVLIALCWHSL